MAEALGVWDTAWLFESTSKVPTPNLDCDPLMKVGELIDPEDKKWKLELANSVLMPEEVKLLQTIPISHRLPKDIQYWWPNKDGVFSVRSAY